METTTSPTETVASTQELLGQLATSMSAVDTAKAEIARIELSIADELGPVRLDLDEAANSVRQLRALIDERMTEEGVRTIETPDGRLQCQRAKTTKLTIVDLDRAQAHLADLDRLAECQIVSIDREKVLWIAQTIEGGIEGVEDVTTYAFKAITKKVKS